LRSEELGGGALARSPLFGRVEVQFGTIVAGKMPFTISLRGPTPRLNSKTERLLKLLPPGTQAGLLGMHGTLRFPRVTYFQRELSLTTDPYKVSVGSVDVDSGEFHNAILRKYLFQNIMKKLLLVEPRTPTDSFCYICNGHFRVVGGGLAISLYGDFNIPYPNGYHFPLPKYGSTKIGEESHLQPFVNLDAVESILFRPSSESVEVVSSNCRRGNFDANAIFLTYEGDQETHRIDLQTQSSTNSGKVTCLNKIAFQSCSIYEFEVVLRTRGSKEGCYGFIINKPPNCQLLMISESENFDMWLEGSFRSLSEGP
jgi:hypothetical protein